jgi:GNAT superfamily N-acetyltransferase
MRLEDITIRLAGPQDLDELNQVVEQAIMSWRLPDRVKQLALPSYRYSDLDMQHMEILAAVGPNKAIIGLAACESSDDGAQHARGAPAILLHGIYVLPEYQRHGIGSHLLGMVEETARSAGLCGILVKAQTDAVGFFRAKGYSQLAKDEGHTDFPNRYWKSIG